MISDEHVFGSRLIVFNAQACSVCSFRHAHWPKMSIAPRRFESRRNSPSNAIRTFSIKPVTQYIIVVVPIIEFCLIVVGDESESDPEQGDDGECQH